MYQTEWARADSWGRAEAPIPEFRSRLPVTDVAGVMLLHWQEHCVECAVPQCYSTCRLYVPRADQRCARFAHGIVRNAAAAGGLGFGADIRFRRWAKLETELTGRFVSPRAHQAIEWLDRAAVGVVNATHAVGQVIDSTRSPFHDLLAKLRRRVFRRLGRTRAQYEAFVVECFSPERSPFRLALNLRVDGATIFRHAVEVAPGQNLFSIPVPLPQDLTERDYLLTVEPEVEHEVRMIFTWLDFIVLGRGADLPAVGARGGGPARKVKCVAWDLDNTLWQGILVEEEGAAKLRLRSEAVELIKQLDARGIIQTVVSKNNHDDALAAIASFGLSDYFLYPAINWGQKSANLQQVADRLNINIDTFALIDDSPFERQEVVTALPMVRIYSEQALESLLDRPEFDVPVTSASRQRRLSYLTEVHRETAREVFAGDYLDFLRSCAIKLRIFRPSTAAEILRCLELIERTNQLNLSGRRYDPEAFDRLLRAPGHLCLALECEDRFGSYGIVGFASVVEDGEQPKLVDFVMSCRVAQKRVEHCVIGWLARRASERGHGKLLADLQPTSRNKPLLKVFDDMHFATEAEEAGRVLLALDLATADLGDVAVIALDASDLVGEKVAA
jgi:FkbH-like protein